MTVAIKNVDVRLLDVLKSLVKMKVGTQIFEVDKSLVNTAHIKQINDVYADIPIQEQTLTCNVAKSAIWEMIKDDTWRPSQKLPPCIFCSASFAQRKTS